MAKKLNFREKSETELKKMLGEKREELRVLRFQAAGSRPKDSNAPANTRKDVARILTALSEKASA